MIEDFMTCIDLKLVLTYGLSFNKGEADVCRQDYFLSTYGSSAVEAF